MSTQDDETTEAVVPKGWDPEGFVAHSYRCHQCASNPLDQACPEGIRRLRRAPGNAAPPDDDTATPTESLPIDTETMRDTTARLLPPHAHQLQPADLLDLTLLCRGHLTLLVLEVETASHRRPKDDPLTADALIDVDEARRRLNLTLGGRLHHTLAHAQRLARSVDLLLGHMEKLGGGRPEHP
ncbi:DUF6415 family natural product biosynthesis protein [Streptomyces sp. NPDC002643]